MFVFNRSALAVLLPLALLLGAVTWSNRSSTPAGAEAQLAKAQAGRDQAVAASLPSR